jgi:hypothetical protein
VAASVKALPRHSLVRVGRKLSKVRIRTKITLLKNAVFWDVAPCEFIIDRRFAGMCRLHLQGRRNRAS